MQLVQYASLALAEDNTWCGTLGRMKRFTWTGTFPDNEGPVRRRKALERWRRTVGAVVGAAIKDSDRKQIQVAKAVGISENVLSEIVQGHRKTELGEIVMIAKAINEDPIVLIRRMLSWDS